MEKSKHSRFIPISKWPEYHPDPSPSSLRWMAFSDPEFRRKCIVKRGRKHLINEEAYFKWLAQQNGKSEF